MDNKYTCTQVVENWENEFINHDWYGVMRFRDYGEYEEPTLQYVGDYEQAKALLLEYLAAHSGFTPTHYYCITLLPSEKAYDYFVSFVNRLNRG